LFSYAFSYNVGDTLDNDIIHKLELKKEKIYVLDFFASWCVSCKIELPLISKTNNLLDKTKYKIIGIDIDEEKEEGLAFQNSFKKKKQLNFSVINDNDNSIVEKFNPIGVPALYYIKNLKVVGVIFGAVDNIDKKILNDLKKIGQ